jgi:hypothetical protein
VGGVRNRILVCAVVLAVVAVLAAVASGAVSPSQPTYVSTGTLEFTPNDGFTPRALSKTARAPIALTLDANIGTADGSHPPALQNLAIELDKNISLDLNRFPFCNLRNDIDVPGTPAERCRPAIIGRGTMTLEIAFAEAQPIPVQSRVQIINGTRKHGIRTLYLATYISVPTPAEIVTTVQIKAIHNGRYGSEATMRFPKIAGGSGSITSLNLRIKKQLPFEAKRFSPVSAKCPDGKLQLHDTATFFNYETSETLIAAEELRRTCTGR